MGLILTSASQAFSLLLMIGSGTGLIYILRWFWWRINAYTEIVAMISSLFIALYFNFINTGLLSWQKIVIGSILTTLVWVAATFITPADDIETLKNFVKKVNPGGPGWKKFQDVPSTEAWSVPNGIIAMILGCITIYGVLLGVGQIIYGHYIPGFALFGIVFLSGFILKRQING